jgi:hypothetical protein
VSYANETEGGRLNAQIQLMCTMSTKGKRTVLLQGKLSVSFREAADV